MIRALILISLCLPATALGQGVWRGPFLNDVTSDAVTVVWETPTATTGTLRYGALDIAENTIDITTASTHHSVRLTGLLALTGGPGREVVYELEVNGEPLTRTGRFSTAVDATTPFAFVVYGDNRSNTIQHEAVVAAILSDPTPIRFVVSSGDMVSDGQNEDHWDDFFEIEAPLVSDLPIYAAIGNHEVDDGSWGVTRRIFELPTTVPPASDEESYYHFFYGNVEIIVVNIETDGLYRIIDFVWGPQETWLRDVLDPIPPNVDHRFLIIHQGPYSSKPGRNGNALLRAWLDELKDFGVTAVISGHDHYAERGWSHNGLPYAIHGGGGAPLYDTLGPRVTPDHTVVYSEATLGYLLVEIDGPLAQIWTKGLNGEMVDYYAYGDPTNPECLSDTDCTVPPVYGCPDGDFECLHGACAWSGCTQDLSALIGCVPFANTCAEDLDATCVGTATCVGIPPNSYCECPDAPSGDCATTADCIGRPPPVAGCAGSYVCVDLACEFIPDDGICGPPAQDGGPPGGDAGPAGGDEATPGDPGPAGGDEATAGGDEATASGDASTGAGGSGGSAGTGGSAGATGTGGSGSAGSGVAGEGGSTGAPAGGCSCSTGTASPLALLALFGLIWLRRRNG